MPNLKDIVSHDFDYADLLPRARTTRRSPPDAPPSASTASTLEHEPTLISSVSGQIDSMFFMIPGVLLVENTADPRFEELRLSILAGYRSLLSQLPKDCPLIILTDGPKKEVRALLDSAGRSASLPDDIFNPTKKMAFWTNWAEDPFCVVRTLDDGKTVLVEPDVFPRGDVEGANELAPRISVDRTNTSAFFAGGNTLAGDGSWFIGADSLVNLSGGAQASESEIEKAYASLETQRKPIPIRATFDKPPDSWDSLLLEDWKEFSPRSIGENQPLYHIDLFMSLAIDKDDKMVVVLGSPKKAKQHVGWEWRADIDLQDAFDQIEAQLSPHVRVIRNPMPLIWEDFKEAKTRVWYFALYNNVIVQNAPEKVVWMPAFDKEAQLQDLHDCDEANAAVWTELGYEVRRVRNFLQFVYRLGAVHCVKKVLGRRP